MKLNIYAIKFSLNSQNPAKVGEEGCGSSNTKIVKTIAKTASTKASILCVSNSI